MCGVNYKWFKFRRVELVSKDFRISKKSRFITYDVNLWCMGFILELGWMVELILCYSTKFWINKTHGVLQEFGELIPFLYRSIYTVDYKKTVYLSIVLQWIKLIVLTLVPSPLLQIYLNLRHSKIQEFSFFLLGTNTLYEKDSRIVRLIQAKFFLPSKVHDIVCLIIRMRTKGISKKVMKLTIVVASSIELRLANSSV